MRSISDRVLQEQKQYIVGSSGDRKYYGNPTLKKDTVRNRAAKPVKKAKRKINCWEFKKCGREPGGTQITSLGVCPTSIKTSVNGINGGINGGRVCWLVAGTYAKHKAELASCVVVKNVSSCYECDFHSLVLNEEGFTLTDDNIKKNMEYRKNYFSL